MKKIALLGCTVAILLQSCSTGNMFTHKRYGHLNWIDHDTKIETNGKAQESYTEQKVTKKSIETNTNNEIKANNTVTEEISPAITNEKTEISPVVKNNTIYQLDAVTEEHVDIEPTTVENTETQQPIFKSSSSVKEIKEGSTGELLLMAVLIALALIIFFVLDSALGGILSLILIIFLILVLLRYFGVI